MPISSRSGHAVVQAVAAALILGALIAVGALVASGASALPKHLVAPVPQPHWSSELTTLDFQRVDVPISVRDGTPLVHAWVNGQGPYLFLVDTGCSFPLALDATVADQLGLPLIGDTDNTDGAGRVEIRELRGVEALDLGGVRFASVAALTDDFRFVAPDDKPFVGLIGFPLFADLLTSIDFVDDRLTFQRGSLDLGDDHVVAYEDWSGLPHVPFDIGSSTVQALVDTGSPLGLSLPWEARDRFGIQGELRDAGSVRTVYAELDWWRGTMGERCVVAGHEFAGLDVNFFNPSSEPAIGCALLEDKIVIIDIANERLAITPAVH